MNPDKLFDYLDGNLPVGERDRIETQLASDTQLQRQLAMAREIHKGMRTQRSREVFLSADQVDEQRAGRMGRRVAIAFAVLVFVNVLVGIAFIAGRGRSPKSTNPEVRDQVSTSLERAAAAAMPAPTLTDDIVLSVSGADRNSVADKVVAAAERCGGSAAKALPSEHTTTVIVELSGDRENDFRSAMVPLGAAPSLQTPPAGDPAAKRILQVQINERDTVPAHPQASP